ncbi:MAG: glycosyltransferase, partial [Candidatus Paceibacteria bacterium]
MPEKRKTVLYLVTKSGMGGASRAVYDISRALPEGYEALVAAGAEGGGELFEKLSEAGIRTVELPALGRNIMLWGEIRSFFTLLSLLRRERPDVVHLNSPKAGGLGALAARLAGIQRIIYTAHGWAFYEDRPFYQLVLIRLFSYLTLLLTHTTVAVSKKDAHAFDGWPFTRGKIVHIPNGVSLDGRILSREKARSRFAECGVSFPYETVIGTVAELHKNKGLSCLIEAAAEVPDAVFVIIGEGEERRRLTLAIAAHKLQHRVFLVGNIPDVSRFMSAFDIFALPSVKEGLPYVLLEAGAAGLPIVASDIGGIPDIIDEATHGAQFALRMVSPDGHVWGGIRFDRQGSSWARPEN